MMTPEDAAFVLVSSRGAVPVEKETFPFAQQAGGGVAELERSLIHERKKASQRRKPPGSIGGGSVHSLRNRSKKSSLVLPRMTRGQLAREFGISRQTSYAALKAAYLEN
jgi:DNA invertase Pin-like site-specific DNA recombinase